MKQKILSLATIVMITTLLLSACGKNISQGKLTKLVASTTLVGDVVKQIGGDRISLTVLLPVGADPHTYEPRPQDAAAITDAQVVFLNGLELEHSLEPLIESNVVGMVVEVSDGVDVLPFSESHEGESENAGEGHDHAVGDPHTWMDPNLVMIWVKNISEALSKTDPENAAYFEKNSKKYLEELKSLDLWIQTEVAKIPQENRKLVTDHENLGYFVNRYGFTLVGLVVDSLSTGASPSAQDLSALEDVIVSQGVKAIFVGTSVNPALSEQVAKDTGAKLISINTESLGDANSDIATYIQFMEKMVTAIVDGLQ
jgi:manganese/iron transport system substrate-binding protein